MDISDSYIKRLESLSLEELQMILVAKKLHVDAAEEAKQIANNEGRTVDWK